VASGAANLFHLKENGIVVAIDKDVFHHLKVARLFALEPQSLAGAAIIMGLARFYGFVSGLFVHVSDHEHVARLVVLDNDRHEAIALFEIYLLHQLDPRIVFS
jgi:hypothetical protein